MVRKRTDYARAGVGELWLVDPEGPSALVLRLPAGPSGPAEFVLVEEVAVGELTSPAMPALAIRLDDLVEG